jgi:hypothetical protein
MKIFAIVLAVVFFLAAVSYEFSIYMTFHPRRAALSAVLCALALVWFYFLNKSAKQRA